MFKVKNRTEAALSTWLTQERMGLQSIHCAADKGVEVGSRGGAFQAKVAANTKASML